MKNIKIKYVVLFASSLLLQSCFVAKDYEAPKVETDNLYRTEQSVDSTSIAMLSWEELFADSYLQGYIKEALQNNLDMQIALQNMQAAEATMKQGKAGYYPSLGLNTTWTHQELAKNSQFGSFFNGSLDNYEASASLSWEADIWGKIRSNKRATVAQYLQTEAATQAVQTQLVASVASLYYQMLAVDAQIKIVKQNLVNRVESVTVIKALKDAGNVNEVAVKQTEAQQYATEVTLKDLEYNIKVLENTFSQLLGKPSNSVVRSSFDNQAIDVDVKVGLPAYLLSNRPDVIAAEMNFRNTFELTNVARSAFYPSLTINATSGFQSIELDKWFSANSIFGNIVSGLAQPIFSKRQNKTRLEVAKANQQKALLEYQKALLTAGKEVSDALAMYENETDKLSVRKKQLDALQSAANYSDELLQYGMVSYLEVLTAKDNALSTEINYISNQYNQMNAVIDLYRALGGGKQ